MQVPSVRKSEEERKPEDDGDGVCVTHDTSCAVMNRSLARSREVSVSADRPLSLLSLSLKILIRDDRLFQVDTGLASGTFLGNVTRRPTQPSALMKGGG